jgi:NAD+ synthase (glutamine-hydrolysing)
MKIALCQCNPVMGDIAGNTQRLLDVLSSGDVRDAELLVFPELFVQGYPPRDLLLQPWFIELGTKALAIIRDASKKHPDKGVLFGFAMPNDRGSGKRLSNAAILVCNGEIVSCHEKSLLPTYDVFDESRYFDPAESRRITDFRGERLGITICEDAWNEKNLWDRLPYDFDPVEELAGMGATVFINLSASPFHLGKERVRLSLAQSHAKRHGRPFILVNQTGGNDELIFDGASMAVDKNGSLRLFLPSFAEAVRVVDTAAFEPGVRTPDCDPAESACRALVTGLSDYARKCGFTKAIVGLSGGIDSAVTAAIAAEALGSGNVWGVTMPSRYSSEGSVADSRALAGNLGIRFSTIPIEEPFGAFLETLEPAFKGTAPDITEENLQARIRGTILMALSNKFGHLLLSTGNKSEIAVGYCTLYGDMNGGLGVISDLPKTMVYKVANYINSRGEVIPQACITKPPSAELKPDQKDQDTLPPYDILDRIIELFVEDGKSSSQIEAEGFDPKTVAWVVRAISRSEYKRRQAAPGLKVTPKAFGSGRRFPLAARYGL